MFLSASYGTGATVLQIDGATVKQLWASDDALSNHYATSVYHAGYVSDRELRSLYEHGHLVANHSFHHDEWRWLDPRYPELERAQLAFQKEIGACPEWFRPPNGDRTPFMAHVVHRHGMRMAMWDVSANDGPHQTSSDIVKRVLSHARGGSIIDLRDGVDGASAADKAALVRALPGILQGLRAMPLQPVRLDQLVGGPAYTSCGGHTS